MAGPTTEDLQKQLAVADAEESLAKLQHGLKIMKKNRLSYLIQLQKVEADILIQEKAVKDKMAELEELQGE
jgi:hypothetical protein